MNAAQFAATVRRLERRAEERPALYRLQVAALALLGYAYVVGAILLLVGMVFGAGYLVAHVGGGAILLKLLLPLLGLTYVLAQAMWIRVPDLDGIELTPDRFPLLASTIERIRTQVDAPPFRRVLLDGDFNAAVTQRPRFGLLGPSVSDLAIGLPLLQALTPAEFEAVLAHEFGHVSRQHGRFGHWVYRVRVTWSRLAYVVDTGGAPGTRLLLGRFLSWYAPFFAAYSFVLARLDEYEADSTAVRVAGRQAFAGALVRVAVLGRFHAERYWADISRRLTTGGELPTPHREFARYLNERMDSSDSGRWFDEALRRPTDDGDTHPSLGDRLRSAGAAAPSMPPGPPTQAAADALLGPAAASLAEELDRRWRSEVEPHLTVVRERREAAERRLAELDEGAWSLDPAWERIEMLERLGRGDQARASAEALLRAQPDHARALYYLGEQRLVADQADGIGLLERAAALMPRSAPSAQGLIAEYHWRHGRRDDAMAARARMDEASERLTAANAERSSVNERPVLVPHDLPPAHVERIRAALKDVPGIREVYLVRRVVVQMPEVPCYFVGVEPPGRWWRFRREREGQALREAVMAAAPWPESTFFVVGERPHARLVRRMRRIPGARLTGDAAGLETPPLSPATLDSLRAGVARRRLLRRRVKLATVTALIGLLAMVTVAYRLREEAIATTPIREVSVAELADRVRGARGRVVVLVLYTADADVAPWVGVLHRWAAPLGRSRVELMALTVGTRRDAQALFRYAVERGLPRLPPVWLEPWASGALDSTMGELGITVGRLWKTPLVAVIDRQGNVVRQWQGAAMTANAVIAAGNRALASGGSGEDQ